MPAFVKTAADEKRWKRAKKAVRKSTGKRLADFTSRDWGLVTHIYRRIKADVSAAVVDLTTATQRLVEHLEGQRPLPPSAVAPLARAGLLSPLPSNQAIWRGVSASPRLLRLLELKRVYSPSSRTSSSWTKDKKQAEVASRQYTRYEQTPYAVVLQGRPATAKAWTVTRAGYEAAGVRFEEEAEVIVLGQVQLVSIEVDGERLAVEASYATDTLPTFGQSDTVRSVGYGQHLGELTPDDVQLNSVSEWAALMPRAVQIKRRAAALAAGRQAAPHS